MSPYDFVDDRLAMSPCYFRACNVGLSTSDLITVQHAARSRELVMLWNLGTRFYFVNI